MYAHNDSRSQTELTLSWEGLRFSSRVQSLSLIEELPGLDPDGDGLLSAMELEFGSQTIVQCLAEGYRLGPDRLPPGMARLRLIEPFPREFDGFGMPTLQEVRVEWEASWPAELMDRENPELANQLFLESSPGHLDRLSYRFDGGGLTADSWTAGGRAIVLVGSPWQPVPAWQALVSTAWQGGGGLALALALACLAKQRREGLQAMIWTWLWLIAPIAIFAWFLPHVGRPGPGGALFLPVALVYVLADSKLGGGWLQSRFAAGLWGAAFAVGAWAQPGAGNVPTWSPEGLWHGLAATLCYLVGMGLSCLRRNGPAPVLFHVAWLGAVAVGLGWVLRLWV
ncbi:MAG: hypothetical protein P1V35_05550 [Planctomycetota bacterium]|nr:hypothetical protein [Planctomycetota bacterium]